MVSTLNGEMQFFSSSTKVASHLYHNSSSLKSLGTPKGYVTILTLVELANNKQEVKQVTQLTIKRATLLKLQQV
jgi:hypothetical protein